MPSSSKADIAKIVIEPQQVAHRIITEKLREKIFRGEFGPGVKLPSTGKLAALWKTSKSTAHTALNNLVKEGLLERQHGSCTYVRDRPLSLDRIAIYHDSTCVWSDEEAGFYRSLQGVLERKLEKMGIDAPTFVDRRSEENQSQILPELRQAIFAREIQGLIIPRVNAVNFAALVKLPLPLALVTGAIGPANKVAFDDTRYFRETLSRLAKKGCRSVGLINAVEYDRDAPHDTEHKFFEDDFLREAAELGLKTRSEWIATPREYVDQKARYGYTEFHKLWSRAKRPEAILVYPDTVVRGVVTAILELSAHQKNEMMFCFHRNAHLEILCPFPVLWSVSDEEKVADALIDMVHRQYKGKPVSPIWLPFDYQFDQSTISR